MLTSEGQSAEVRQTHRFSFPPLLLPIFALWRREMVRFIRQRSRLSGAFLQPLVFWLLLGGGLNASFRPAGTPGDTSYMGYFYPGTIALVLLFTAIFATIATVEDRKSGFLQGVMVAPIPRWAITTGQALGGTSLAVLQGILFLLFAPFAGIPLTLEAVVASILVMTIMALALTNLGLIIAWRTESTQGFHAIMNLLLLPIWFLSGAFFPASGAPLPLRVLMTVNPLTYGMAALRQCLYLGHAEPPMDLPPLGLSVMIMIVFAIVMALGAARTAERRRAF